MSLHSKIKQFEEEVTLFEKKVTSGLVHLIIPATKIVDIFVDAVIVIDNEIPVITSALDTPVAKAIAGLIPNGTSYLSEIILFLNSVEPYLKHIKDHKQLLNGAKLQIASTITHILDDKKTDYNQVISDVQQAFITTPIPS